jgi:hypothetical protein
MDLRQADRRCLVFYLRVFDGLSSKILGHVINMSEKGVLLMTDGSVEPNEDYRLRICLPAFVRDRHEVVVKGTSKWCKKEAGSDQYFTGFQIYDLDASTEKIVLNLIKDLGFKEATRL